MCTVSESDPEPEHPELHLHLSIHIPLYHNVNSLNINVCYHPACLPLRSSLISQDEFETTVREIRINMGLALPTSSSSYTDACPFFKLVSGLGYIVGWLVRPLSMYLCSHVVASPSSLHKKWKRGMSTGMSIVVEKGRGKEEMVMEREGGGDVPLRYVVGVGNNYAVGSCSYIGMQGSRGHDLFVCMRRWW